MNRALVAFATELRHGLPALSRALRGTGLSPDRLSSVYRRVDPETEGTLHSELLFVAQFVTPEPLPELKARLAGPRQPGAPVEILLLTLNHLVHLDPQNPVPHPELHLDPLILHCAAEIQGDFEHPVLGRSLQELVKSTPNSRETPAVEFVCRGEKLLSPDLEAR